MRNSIDRCDPIGAGCVGWLNGQDFIGRIGYRGMTSTDALDTLLAGYVAGGLPEPARVLVASHLEISERNRPFVRQLEAMAGAELETIEPIPIRHRDERLARIFALTADEPPRAPPSRHDPRLPDALARFLGRDLPDLRWRTLLPGVRECRLGETDGCEATLYWIRGGKPIPAHTHEGLELTLVLDGAFSDGEGRYGRGEIAIADDEVDHRPIAEPGTDCLCFAVTDAPLRLTGPIGRFFAPFMR